MLYLSAATDIIGQTRGQAERTLREAGLSAAEAAIVAAVHIGAKSQRIIGTAREITATILYTCCESVSLGLR